MGMPVSKRATSLHCYNQNPFKEMQVRLFFKVMKLKFLQILVYIFIIEMQVRLQFSAEVLTA